MVQALARNGTSLISVTPVKARYNGEIGVVVVGRIMEVQQKCWKVDINSMLDAVLMLSSGNLPGGDLRGRSMEDVLMMRRYLEEGDSISASKINLTKRCKENQH